MLSVKNSCGLGALKASDLVTILMNMDHWWTEFEYSKIPKASLNFVDAFRQKSADFIERVKNFEGGLFNKS